MDLKLLFSINLKITCQKKVNRLLLCPELLFYTKSLKILIKTNGLDEVQLSISEKKRITIRYKSTK